MHIFAARLFFHTHQGGLESSASWFRASWPKEEGSRVIKRVRGGRIRGVLAVMQVTGDQVLGTVVPIVARRGRTVGYAGSHFSAPAHASA